MDLFTPADRRPVHFVGIGGAGMSALALIARRRGVVVSGCDTDAAGRGRSRRDGRAASGRGTIRRTWTAPAPWWSPRRCRRTIRSWSGPGARAAGGPAEGSAGRAGRHGALGGGLGHPRQDHHDGHDHRGAHRRGARPTGIAGGRVSAWGGNARIAGDDLFVVEADEYDQAFLTLHPDGRRGEQRRARPPRVLRLHGRAGGCLRRVRRARRDAPSWRRRPRRAAGGRPARRQRRSALRLRRRSRRRGSRTGAAAERTEAASAGGAAARSGCGSSARGAQPAERRRGPGRGRRARRRARPAAAALAGSRASAGGSSGWARSGVSRSSTTTPTTPPSWRPRSPRRARPFPAAGWWRSSSRICTRARRRTAQRWARHWPRPTWSSSPRYTRRGSSPFPA